LQLRARLGLGVFVAALGVMHFIETYLAAVFYVQLPFGIVSPGSVVLFSGKLMIILLLYVKEDAATVRQPIYGLLAGNLLTVILSLLLRQHETVSIVPGRSADIAFIDEMHHAQGRDKNAETQPGTKLQQPDHRRDVDQCFADENNEIGVGHAVEKVPVSPDKPLGGKLKENFSSVADGPELQCENQLLCEVLPFRHSRDQPTVVRMSNQKPRIAHAMAFINGGQACNRRHPRSTSRAARFCPASPPPRRW
jgi:hypothetical protein